MKVLFLSRWFPYPADNGSKIRIFNVLRQLSQQHEVSLVTFADKVDQVNEANLDVLRRYCANVRVFPFRPYRSASPRALLGFFSRRPRLFVDTFSEDVSEAIREAGHEHKFDLVIASQLGMAPYALVLPGIPALFEEVELSLFRDGIDAGPWPGALRSAITWLKLSAYLRRILPRFSACTVVSEGERRHLQRAVRGYQNIAVVPNAVDVTQYAGAHGEPRRNTAIFSGALTYSANRDALHFFVSQVYPHIKCAAPDFAVHVTGRTSGTNVRRLPNAPGIQYTGYVADIRPRVAQSWMSVVPIRQGGGTRLKILEAMALGTPVVATKKGADGLDVTDGENILLADHPQLFADQAVRLLQSPALRSRLAAGGRRLVAEKYDWRVVGPRLTALAEKVAAGGPM